MKSTTYSEKVLNHFRKPHNVGVLEGKNVAVGRVGNPVCGDLMEMYIKVENDRIKDIKFQTFGCGSAIATSSMITDLVRGKTLDEAMKVTRNDVADELDGLPPIKMHCSNLAADALHAAIKNYQKEKAEGKHPEEECVTGKPEGMPGEKKFAGNGLYDKVEELSNFADERILLLDEGEDSVNLAIELTKYSPRVVLITCKKRNSEMSGLKKELKESDVKVLYESELLELRGEDEVEKVLIHDLDEDDEYELFADSVIILKSAV